MNRIQEPQRHRPDSGEREAWQEHAACRQVDPELFYPLSIEDSGQQPQESAAPARAVCRRCPVRTQCLDWALERREQWGIWGGTTWSERRAMLARTGDKPAPTPAPRPEMQQRQSDQDTHTLRIMHAAGATDRMIARALSCNEKTVRERRHKLGLKPQYQLRSMRGRAQVWTRVEREQMQQMHTAGATARQIADAISRTPEAVYRKQQRLGLVGGAQDTEEET